MRVQMTFDTFWKEQNKLAAAERTVDLKGLEFHNPLGNYYEAVFPATDGTPLHMRCIWPASATPAPTVLMFHDYGRGIRGWHHMTRFLALGYGVAALENRCTVLDISDGWHDAPYALTAAQLYIDALTAAHVARTFPEVDADRLMTWGEGLGGGLAIAAAAFVPGIVKCAVLNPLPADFRAVWQSGCDAGIYAGIKTHFRNEDPQGLYTDSFFQAISYLDCSRFAALMQCPFLMGTGAMDLIAPAGSQDTVMNGVASEKKHLIYPKYGHERINFFENELLKFLHP